MHQPPASSKWNSCHNLIGCDSTGQELFEIKIDSIQLSDEGLMTFDYEPLVEGYPETLIGDFVRGVLTQALSELEQSGPSSTGED